VSLEVSPLLAHDAEGTIAAAKGLYARAQRPNLFIKIPGTMEGVTAIEEVIFSGVPVNVTLLFSREHYLAAAGAYMRGIGRRIAAGLDPRVASVASVFISRWDVAANRQLAEENHNRLGIAIAGRTDKAYRESLSSRSWDQLAAAGARPQRLLWASTGTKDPKAPDDLYVESLIAPETINTLPENTLLAVGDHGRVGELMREDGGSAEQVIRDIEAQGVDVDALAARLQDEGAAAFEQSWTDLMECIASKG
jgi:transaldolase